MCKYIKNIYTLYKDNIAILGWKNGAIKIESKHINYKVIYAKVNLCCNKRRCRDIEGG